MSVAYWENLVWIFFLIVYWSGICRSIYYAATDVVILRFMIEVCWAPMLAAFSVPLDQSDDEVIIALCLDGFCSAIHVTAVMSMKTHRDAFVTSLAKFTSLHSPADIKQKNIDAIKVGNMFYSLVIGQVKMIQKLSWFMILLNSSIFVQKFL